MEKLQYKLDAFEGPMDLLLHLISKHKLNINDIPIFDLVEQYTAYVRQMQQADMDIASDFIEMAARLVYIKTVSLLPVHDQAEQLKKELTGELIEYRDCKQIAKMLSEHTQGFDSFVRQPIQLPINMKYERLHDAVQLVRSYLVAIGKNRTIPQKEVNITAIVAHKIVSVSSRVAYIISRLSGNAKLRFRLFFAAGASRSEAVATFLAMLELIKANKIIVHGDSADPTVELKQTEGQR